MRPSFELRQDDDFVVLVMTVRYLRERDLQFYVGDREFRFFSPPYELRVLFDHELIEDGSEKATYQPETGLLTVRLPKKEPGKVFSILPNEEDDDDNDDDEMVKDGKEQEKAPVYYGFNDHHSGVFRGLAEYEVLELPDPEGVSAAERRLMRLAAEESKFDGDYYVGDLLGRDDFSHVLSFVPFWSAHVPERVRALDAPPMPPVVFSEQDHIVLARLPAKAFLLQNERRIVCDLVDILFAFVYNELTSAGEDSCEASWTISRLSRAFAWLDSSEENLESSLVTSYRRALSYPLYRNWELCTVVHRHVASVLRAGRAVVVKCLLQIHHAMTHNAEKRYLINIVFVDDYISWVQSLSEAALTQLAETVERIVVRKEAVEFNLIELEELARNHEQEEGEEQEGGLLFMETGDSY